MPPDGLRTIEGIFQSTQPKRAATVIARRQNAGEKISIHAAQEGCDSTAGSGARKRI